MSRKAYYKPNAEHRRILRNALLAGMKTEKIGLILGVSDRTLFRHYPDVYDELNLPAVREDVFEATPAHRKLVTLSAAIGIPQKDIARNLGIANSTLLSHFQEELKNGSTQANLRVGGKMYEMATGSADGKNTLGAAIWWTKARMKWKETREEQHTGPDGGPIKTQNQVIVMLPDNGRGDTNPESFQTIDHDATKLLLEAGVPGEEDEFAYAEGSAGADEED